MNPVHGFVLATFGHHQVVAERSNGVRGEGEISVRGNASEQRHQVLARGWAVESPVQVGGQNPLHSLCISRS